MIKAVFFKKDGRLSGFSLSGHAGYGTRGNDVCCAAVSSAAELVCNTVTDFFGCDAQAEAADNCVTLNMKSGCGEGYKLIESFYTHLGFIAEEFPHGIMISINEIPN